MSIDLRPLISMARARGSMLNFNDRRSNPDRRKLLDSDLESPASLCRRRGERRNKLRQYEAKPWWLQVNYVEEIQPPHLFPLSDCSMRDTDT